MRPVADQRGTGLPCETRRSQTWSRAETGNSKNFGPWRACLKHEKSRFQRLFSCFRQDVLVEQILLSRILLGGAVDIVPDGLLEVLGLFFDLFDLPGDVRRLLVGANGRNDHHD